MIFLDTNIAISLRDVDVATYERVRELGDDLVISVITRIELENGVYRSVGDIHSRRRLLDRLLQTLTVEMFTEADVLAYGRIIQASRHNRLRTLDRLIAAQAVARDALLVTRDAKDFRQIADLRLQIWTS